MVLIKISERVLPSYIERIKVKIDMQIATTPPDMNITSSRLILPQVQYFCGAFVALAVGNEIEGVVEVVLALSDFGINRANTKLQFVHLIPLMESFAPHLGHFIMHLLCVN